MRFVIPLLLLSLPLAAQPAATSAEAALSGFDGFVERAMREMKAPGAAVGVLLDGKPVLAKGYGVRAVSGTQPVTADTVFAVGSVTKSFTAMTVALMVDEGKLAWDRPVRDYLPWFRLHDPVATDLITARDLLTHRSGLPRYDSLRFLVPMPSREELVRRLRFLPPNRTFRDVYQYNNLLYVTAGYLAGEAAGSTWEDLVINRIFRPLGMTSSTVSVTEMQKGSDFARPHAMTGGRAVEIEFYDYQRFAVGPNGAVNSSVTDLLKYARLYLEGGQAGGRQIVSSAQTRELWRPVSVSGDSTYALGWSIGSHRGRRRISHGGAITGFTANLAIFPEEKLAIVVLNNLGTRLPQMLTDELADRFLGLPAVDYLRRFREERDKAAQALETARKALNPRVPNTKPSKELNAYAGEYEHPAYGRVRITRETRRLVLAFPVSSIPLEHYHYDWFQGSGQSGTVMAQFQIDQRGEVTRVLLNLEPEAAPLEFERVARGR